MSRNAGKLDQYQITNFYQRDRDAKQSVLDERIPDIHFARWSQNDDKMSAICTTEFIGQFDIISRQRKNLQSEFMQNPVEVKFRNKTDDDDEIDEILQGKYRTDRRKSKSKQCFQVAQDDVIDVGFGAWRLVTESEDDMDTLSTNLEITRETIPEAIRRVFFDANARLLDKSDAKCCSVITSFTEDGYKSFLEELGINQDNITLISFDEPYISIYEKIYPNAALRYPFFNHSEQKLTLLEFYNIEYTRQKFYLYLDDEAKPYSLKKEEAERQKLGKPIREKTILMSECFKYISNGAEILKRTRVPGGKIPVIPAYGERNFVEDTENHYGIIKGAKDPQNLINSSYNYLASMMMFSPIPKPEFDPREIEGLEHFHEGVANNHELAYVLRNKDYVNDDESVTQFGQATYTIPQQIPPAVATLIASLPAMTDSILNPGVTEDAFDTQASGVALQEIRDQIGINSYIYLDNFAEAMRRDGEVYAAMVAEIFDTERKVVLTNADNTTSSETVNKKVIDFLNYDEKNGFKSNTEKMVHGQRFDVHFDVGPSYKSKKDAELTNLKEIYQTLPPNDPMQEVLLLTILSKQTGEGMDELNKFSRMTILEKGLPGFEPQTEEEEQYIAQIQQQKAQQQQQPDPNMLMAQAENKKGDADIMKEQRESLNDEVKAKVSVANLEIDQFKAETERQKVQVEAAKASADIDNKEADTMNKRVKTVLDVKESATRDLQLSNNQLE